MYSIDPRLSNSNQPIPFNNAEENVNLVFSDPISLEQMQNPVIDQAGHSFERSTIDSLVAAAIHKGQPLLCPIGGEPIDPNRLVPNLLGRDCIEQIHIARAKNSTLEHKCQQESKEKVMLQKEVEGVTGVMQHCRMKTMELADQCRQINDEKEALEYEFERVNGEKEELEATLREADGLMGELVKEMRNHFEKSQAELENVKKENADVKQSLEMIVAQLRSNDAQNQQIIRRHEQNHQELIRKIDDQNRKIDTLTAENREMKSTIHTLKVACQASQKETQTLQLAHQASQKEVQKLRRENQEVRHENQEVRRESQKASHENQMALRMMEESNENLLIQNKQLMNTLNMTPFDHIAVNVFCVPRERFTDRDLPQRKVRQHSGEQQLKQDSSGESKFSLSNFKIFLKSLKKDSHD